MSHEVWKIKIDAFSRTENDEEWKRQIVKILEKLWNS